jgi:vacuole morphology and inheritance protein 14
MSKKKAEDPLPPTIIRNLADKLYDKRKLGALEIEQLIKDLVKIKDVGRIGQIIQFIKEQFIGSTSVNSRKGGLIALAAAALGLSSDIDNYIIQLLPPVLQCFVDPDNKVRYYACESLYNMAKVARGKILPFFNELFDGLCKMAADPDVNVRNGAELLDRLIKDVVTEGNPFDLEKFIPLLSDRVNVFNPECRKFLVGWIDVLDKVPDIELLDHLAAFLDGLFNMLSDQSDAIRTAVETTLMEFCEEIKQKKSETIDYAGLIKILVPHCTSKDEYTSTMALIWINEFISFGKEKVLPLGASILTGILPSLSHKNKDIEEIARRANKSFRDLVQSTSTDIDVKEFLDTIKYWMKFTAHSVPTRIDALRWILTLHMKSPTELLKHLDDLYPDLLKTLTDPSEDVVRMDLQVVAKLSQNEQYFDKLMHNILLLFATDKKLLESRGSLILRQLSLYIKPEQIYVALAKILESEKDPSFSSTMIQILNLILLTATELHETREALRALDNKQSKDLFCVLYKSWCHNPAAVFSFCLLAQVYEHAYNLLGKFHMIEVNVHFLMEIDKLVQLLESPVFMGLRLQLLEPDRYPYLVKSLFGILMILPQSGAYETLRNRLNAITSLGVLQMIPHNKNAAKPPSDIDFGELLTHFERVQKTHSEIIRAARLENEKRVQTRKQVKMLTGEPETAESSRSITPRDSHNPSLNSSSAAVPIAQEPNDAPNK